MSQLNDREQTGRYVAVRKGKIRCAPFCGRDCTEAEYREAHRIGKKALTMLRDRRGWTYEVWENLGWHVKLRKGGLKVHINKYDKSDITYSTLLSYDPNGIGGEPELCTNECFDNPQEAIDYQRTIARKQLKSLKAAIKLIESL